jgi:flagellar biogenesis protein FliO
MGGAAAWLMARLRGTDRKRSRLELLERIALGPRQSLSLIEAEGRKFLVATSAEGAPAFYPLDEREERARAQGPTDDPAHDLPHDPTHDLLRAVASARKPW